MRQRGSDIYVSAANRRIRHCVFRLFVRPAVRSLTPILRDAISLYLQWNLAQIFIFIMWMRIAEKVSRSEVRGQGHYVYKCVNATMGEAYNSTWRCGVEAYLFTSQTNRRVWEFALRMQALLASCLIYAWALLEYVNLIVLTEFYRPWNSRNIRCSLSLFSVKKYSYNSATLSLT